jgi:hypothetical protein
MGPLSPTLNEKRTALQNWKFSQINSVLWVISAFWDPDADSESGWQTEAGSNPYPKHC